MRIQTTITVTLAMLLTTMPGLSATAEVQTQRKGGEVELQIDLLALRFRGLSADLAIDFGCDGANRRLGR